MERKYVSAQDRSGNIGVNAEIRVKNYPSGTLATVYSDNGVNQMGQPFYTDVNGMAFFYAANGRYIIERTGGGLDSITQTDVTLFDPVDATFESDQVDGIGDLSGQALDYVLLSDGTHFQAVSIVGTIFDTRYAQRNAVTDGWIQATANRSDAAAPLVADNPGTGRLANFRQNGVDKVWFTNLGGAEFSDHVVIQGNLTVHGTETILNTETLQVEDNIIVLNSGVTGTPTLNSGTETERGDQPNSFIGWMETPDRYQWTEDSITYYTVPGLERDETVSGDWNFTGSLQSDGSNIATVNDLQYASSVRNDAVNAACEVAQRPTAELTTTFQVGSVDRHAIRAVGTVAAGTITQDTTGVVGSTETSMHLSGATLSGAGDTLEYCYSVPAKTARKYKNKTLEFALAVLHDVGVSVDYTVSVNKADAENDFSTVTLIDAGIAQGIASSTEDIVTHSVADMGDCSNGFEIVVSIACGAVTAKNFYFSDLRIFRAPTLPPFQPLDFNDEILRCIPFWEKSWDYETAVGTATSVSQVGFNMVGGLTHAKIVTAEFMAEKVKLPTITLYSPNTGAASNVYVNSSSDQSASSTPSKKRLNVAKGASFNWSVIQFHFVADSELYSR